MNFTLLILIQFFNTQQVEFVRRYTHQIPDAQRSINLLNHQSRLANQLFAELLSLFATFDQNNITTGADDITTELQNLLTPVNDQLARLGPNMEEINNITQQINVAVTNENPNVEQTIQLHDMLNRSINQLRPHIVALGQLITLLLNRTRQIQQQIENQITTIRGRLSEQHRRMVDVVIEARNTESRLAEGRQIFQARINMLQREDISEEERLLHAQLSTQIRILINNERMHQAALQQFENQNRQIIESTADIQQLLHLDNIRRRLQQVESQNSTLFQQTEIVAQQLSLVIANPEGHALFPKLASVTFWSRVYRKVASDPNRLNSRVVSLFFPVDRYLLTFFV